MACLFALEQPVVSLGCKYTLILKTGQPELVVHIGGQDKVVFILHHPIQIPVQLCRRHVVPVIINMAAPIGPLLLLGGKRIEPRRIHVPHTVPLYEFPKMILKPPACIGQTGRSRQAASCSDNNSVSLLQTTFQRQKTILICGVRASDILFILFLCFGFLHGGFLHSSFLYSIFLRCSFLSYAFHISTSL